jgi:hypothetical protein
MKSQLRSETRETLPERFPQENVEFSSLGRNALWVKPGNEVICWSIERLFVNYFFWVFVSP